MEALNGLIVDAFSGRRRRKVDLKSVVVRSGCCDVSGGVVNIVTYMFVWWCFNIPLTFTRCSTYMSLQINKSIIGFSSVSLGSYQSSKKVQKKIKSIFSIYFHLSRLIHSMR